MRSKLLDAGVKHLKEFGYPKARRDNILTDLVYRQFFKGMLQGTIEDALRLTMMPTRSVSSRSNIVSACEALIAEIDGETNDA